jgi:hypothetical protein
MQICTEHTLLARAKKNADRVHFSTLMVCKGEWKKAAENPGGALIMGERWDGETQSDTRPPTAN